MALCNAETTLAHWRYAVALLDSLVLCMTALPVALPMIVAGAVPAGDDQDAAHRATASAFLDASTVRRVGPSCARRAPDTVNNQNRSTSYRP